MFLVSTLSTAVAMHSEGVEESASSSHTRPHPDINPSDMEASWETLDILETRRAALSDFLNEEEERDAWSRDYPHNLYIVAFESTDEDFASRVATLRKYRDVLFSREENALILKTALQLAPDQIERGATIINTLSDWLLSSQTDDYERSLIVSTVFGLTPDQINERLETIERYKNLPLMHNKEETDIQGHEWIKVIAAALALPPLQIRSGIEAIHRHAFKLFPQGITPSARILTITGALPHTEEQIQHYFGHRESAKEIFAEGGVSSAESFELASIVWRINIEDVSSRLNLFYGCTKNLFAEDMNIFQRHAILENLLLATFPEMKDRLDALIDCKSVLLPSTLDAIDRCDIIVKALRRSPNQIREWAAQAKAEKPLCALQ